MFYLKRSITQFFSLIALIGMLSSCKVGPDFKAPAAPSDTRYTPLPAPQKTASTSLNKNAGKSQRFIAGRDLEGDWWTIFHSKQINDLVTQGINNNQDLVAAKAALNQATYTWYGEIGGLLLPSVDFSGYADRLKTNPIAVGVGGSAPSVFNVYNASFQATYLIDVWGLSRREIEVYAAQVDYQHYEMLATYLTLTTNIVTTAVMIASLESQIQTTNALISEQTKVLQITKKQFAVGGVSDLNVLSQQTLLSQTEAMLPPLKKSLSGEQHTLAVLLGKKTSEMPPIMLALEHLRLPSTLPVSLPSKLVEQRPDIQASQALLHAASAQLGVATANMLPQLTLNANYGFLAGEASNFFTAQNSAWMFGAGLAQPIFHGGQLWMQRKAAIEALKQVGAQYKQTVLQAFKNVSDALRAVQYDANEFNDLIHAERSARDTYILTKKQYLVGGQNFLAVLQAEEKYQETSLKRIESQAMRYSDTAALYQALGGGWWNHPISQYRVKDSEKQSK